MSAEAVVAIVSVGVVLLIAMLGFIWRNLGKQIGTVKTDLETAANQAHNRIEGNIQAMEDRLSTQIGTVKSDLEAQIGTVKTDLEAQIGTVKTDLEAQIGTVKTDLEAQIGTVKTDLEAQIGTVKSDLETHSGTVKSDLAATRSELTAAIEKQTDRIVEVHRDLRGLGERLARVEANA